MEAEFFFNRGVERTKSKDLTGAIEDFTKAIELSSGMARKTISTDMGDGSVQHIDVIETNEGTINMYFNRACAFLELRSYEAAIEDLSKVVQYDPNDAEAFFKRAVANYCIGNDGQKEEDLAIAHELNAFYSQELFLSLFRN